MSKLPKNALRQAGQHETKGTQKLLQIKQEREDPDKTKQSFSGKCIFMARH